MSVKQTGPTLVTFIDAAEMALDERARSRPHAVKLLRQLWPELTVEEVMWAVDRAIARRPGSDR